MGRCDPTPVSANAPCSERPQRARSRAARPEQPRTWKRSGNRRPQSTARDGAISWGEMACFQESATNGNQPQRLRLPYSRRSQVRALHRPSRDDPHRPCAKALPGAARCVRGRDLVAPHVPSRERTGQDLRHRRRRRVFDQTQGRSRRARGAACARRSLLPASLCRAQGLAGHQDRPPGHRLGGGGRADSHGLLPDSAEAPRARGHEPAGPEGLNALRGGGHPRGLPTRFRSSLRRRGGASSSRRDSAYR